jgi:cation transport ATPase
MKLIFSIIILATAGLCLALAVRRLLDRERRLESRITAALFFCLALFQAQGALYLRGYLFEYPAFFFFHLTVLYLLAPLLYFALYAAALPGEKTPAMKILYFIPAAAALAFDCFYLVQPETNRVLILGNLFFGGFLVIGPVITALAAGAGIQATVLLGMLLARILRRMKHGEKPARPGLLVTTIVLSMVMMDLLSAGYIIKFPPMLLIITLVMCFVIIDACKVDFFPKKA